MKNSPIDWHRFRYQQGWRIVEALGGPDGGQSDGQSLRGSALPPFL